MSEKTQQSQEDRPVQHVPVIVVGGGPSGLACALELELQGIETLVVEPRVEITATRPRAKTTNARTMEFFRRWGVADAVRGAAPLPVDYSRRITFCVNVTGPEITHLDNVLGLDLEKSELTAEPGQQIPQPVIEGVLRERLKRSPLVHLEIGSRVEAVADEGDRVRVEIVDAQGRRREVTADQVVGADGPRSVVRAALGVRYQGGVAGKPNVNITFTSDQLGDLIQHQPSIQFWVLQPGGPGGRRTAGPGPHLVGDLHRGGVGGRDRGRTAAGP